MSNSTAKPQKSLRSPVVFSLVALAIILTAAITLLIARFWLFPPTVTPVVLNSQERAELEQKLEAL